MVPLLKEVKVRSLACGQRQRYLLDKRGKTGSRRRPSISKIPKMAFSNVGALFFLLSHVWGSGRKRAKQTEQNGQQTEQNGQFLGNNLGFIFRGIVFLDMLRVGVLEMLQVGLGYLISNLWGSRGKGAKQTEQKELFLGNSFGFIFSEHFVLDMFRVGVLEMLQIGL